mmetsp:Transcript_25635/g.41850  ORF Transcript_25635/g.41850 Transcript_25635/m.41850 type:complete len:276 (+) Transcript_25635:1304-2131(+)
MLHIAILVLEILLEIFGRGALHEKHLLLARLESIIVHVAHKLNGNLTQRIARQLVSILVHKLLHRHKLHDVALGGIALIILNGLKIAIQLVEKGEIAITNADKNDTERQILIRRINEQVLRRLLVLLANLAIGQHQQDIVLDALVGVLHHAVVRANRLVDGLGENGRVAARPAELERVRLDGSHVRRLNAADAVHLFAVGVHRKVMRYLCVLRKLGAKAPDRKFLIRIVLCQNRANRAQRRLIWRGTRRLINVMQRVGIARVPIGAGKVNGHHQR